VLGPSRGPPCTEISYTPTKEITEISLKKILNRKSIGEIQNQGKKSEIKARNQKLRRKSDKSASNISSRTYESASAVIAGDLNL